MDQTYLHLIVNHLAVIGSILGALVLAYGIYTRSVHTKNAAYLIFVLCALASGITYVTGEAAEETAESISGVSEQLIEAHEEAAIFALAGMLVLGLLSLAALVVPSTNKAARGLSFAVLLVALLSFGIIANTANLGGKIRHTELDQKNATANPMQQTEEHGDDD